MKTNRNRADEADRSHAEMAARLVMADSGQTLLRRAGTKEGMSG